MKKSRYQATIISNFSASHILHGYERGCNKLHGHNWRVEVTIVGNRLNQLGMLMDFAELKSITNQHIKRLDHEHLNELEIFQGVNPTSEHVAKWLYKVIQADLPGDVALGSITLWETLNNSLRYSEDEE